MNKVEALILTDGLFSTNDAKTAHGLVRGTDRYHIRGVIDGTALAGGDAGEYLDGMVRNIPIFESLAAALAAVPAVECLIIGVATVGGVLPPPMKATIQEAIGAGLSIVNGLHEYLSENPVFTALAAEHGVTLTDVRKPKNREDLHFWTGAIHEVQAPIIAVMGMDCALGKRTTARLLKEACLEAGYKAEMIYTGQTGWLQGGKYGFIFDSTLNDFVSGELEHAIVRCWRETKPDFIFIEGQSALRNPSGPCGLEFILSGNAKHIILVHAPKRQFYDNEPHWGTIPSVASEIQLFHLLGAKVLALALNTEDCSESEYLAFQQTYQTDLAIPVLLPIHTGVKAVLPILESLLR